MATTEHEDFIDQIFDVSPVDTPLLLEENQVEGGDEDAEDIEDIEGADRSSEYQPMSDDELISFIKREDVHSLGAEPTDDEVTASRERALNYFYARPRGDERKGRSAVISTDVADVIEATLADIMPVFTGTEQVVWFPAENAQDLPQAQTETDAVNFLFLEQCNGYHVLQTLFKEALLLRNGVAKVFLDDVTTVEEETHRGLTDMELARVLQPTSDKEKVRPLEHDSQETLEQQINPLGQPFTAPVTYHDIRLQRIETKQQISVIGIPLDDFAVNGDHNSPFLDKARFLRHRVRVSRGELLAEGVPSEEVSAAPAVSTTSDEVSRSRDRSDKERDYYTEQFQTEQVWVYEVSCIVDYDGDGFPERRFVRMLEDYIIENVATAYNPFVSVAPFVAPHRWMGISMYDKNVQVQDIKTATWRNLLDNLYQINNQRYEVGQGVNMDDFLVSTPGGVIRSRVPGSIQPLPVTSIGAPGYQMLDYADKVRTEASGASLDSRQSQKNNVPRDTAYGVERVISARESLVGMIAKTFAETGVTEIFRKMHFLARNFLSEDISGLFRGRSLNTNPQQWRPRTRVSVAPSLSIGDQVRKAQALNQIIQMQMGMLQAGKDGTLVTDSTIYAAQIAWGRVSGVESPEDYWVNPASPEGQQAAQQKAQMAQQQMQMEAQQAQQMLDLQVQLQKMKDQSDILQARMKAQTDQMELVFKYRELHEETMNKLTELELKSGEDVPGARV